MRRLEFSCEEKTLRDEILQSCEYGILSLSVDNLPYGVPLNFVWHKEALYYHGADEGRKVELIHANANASFSVVKPLSLIPSHFSNTRSACPATQFFLSLILEGKIEWVPCMDEKAEALNALMQKLQPEGGYDMIDAKNAMYQKMLSTLGVYKLMPSAISFKLKAGQNLSEERKKVLIEKLLERGTKLDELTIKMIKRYM
ncbi:pyridoxamine 5'-phosphate oxidase family protein [Sulfurospirillum barnesii]|uniref:Putative flavin-nucleotide-binding protein n=1 Tax=Sulfurospirillum barnesii (strain ATCC 700032 / DSM 10660 / SES-3) TaxID=760154 RepID=I3XVY6_SULBS|nr:pyridoxamine 5'-phosphate oxidase family protein [Sulfurospirillum barnesii]AFL68110.1 putative flavin-nucleotide-binding protein [Sulfurospirillum barnesii SES-3]